MGVHVSGYLTDNNTPPDNLGSPKHSAIGSVSIIATPSALQLDAHTRRVLANNFYVSGRAGDDRDDHGPLPSRAGEPSQTIKHVIFINKENSTHDQMFGDITSTRSAVPVEGKPEYSLGYDASPNHHELALRYTLGDNFWLCLNARRSSPLIEPRRSEAHRRTHKRVNRRDSAGRRDCIVSGRVRQFEVKGCTGPVIAGRPDPATMGVDNPLADGEPESDTR